MLFVTTTSAMAHAFVLPFAEHMRREGHEIEFACSPGDFEDCPSRVADLRDAGFVVHEVAIAREIRPTSDLRSFVALTRLIRAEHYDLVHTHSSKAGFLGRAAARAARCGFVVHTAHDLYFRAFPSGLKRLAFVAIEKIAAPMCDVMLFVSDAVRDDAIRSRLKDEARLVYVGNGIDLTAFRELERRLQAERRRVKPRDAVPVVGCVGRLVANKGMDTLLKAAKLVLEERPETRFVIAGDGPLRPELEALARSLGIVSNVEFRGYLPEAIDVARQMAELDVFVLPTRREGLGIVYLEAMALGVPVVGSRVEPVTDVVADGRTGLLATVDDPRAFADATLRLLNDADLRRRMGEAGPDYVAQKFELQRVLERTEAVYREVAEALGLASSTFHAPYGQWLSR
jgi:glycosyltransferase involved in cell wall biosynthesis